MTITIFGATGMVGQQLVKLALFAGHTVRAYGRNVNELIDDAERNDNLQLIKGGLFDKGDVEKAIKGADAVLSALGGSMDGSDQTRSLGIKYIVEAMEKHDVKKIVAIGGMGCLQADEDTLIAETENFPAQFKPVTEEHLKALHYLRSSGLEWTFVCPPTINDGDATGVYHTKIDYNPGGYTIHSGDLAQYMLSEMQRGEHIHYKVGIAN
jgi:uncharacterized protein